MPQDIVDKICRMIDDRDAELVNWRQYHCPECEARNYAEWEADKGQRTAWEIIEGNS